MLAYGLYAYVPVGVAWIVAAWLLALPTPEWLAWTLLPLVLVLLLLWPVIEWIVGPGAELRHGVGA